MVTKFPSLLDNYFRLRELSESTQTTYQTVVMNSPVVAKPEKECRVKDGEIFKSIQYSITFQEKATVVSNLMGMLSSLSTPGLF